MSKLFNEQITVHCKEQSPPDAFIWRKKLYRVEEILKWWRQPAAWWNGESEKLFLVVNAKNCSSGTYELYLTDGNWFISRLMD
jgi:hypothetical protein